MTKCKDMPDKRSIGKENFEEMNKLFEKYPTKYVDKLFDILKLVASDTKDLALNLQEKIRDCECEINKSYLKSLKKECMDSVFSKFNSGKDSFGINRDDNKVISVSIWYKNYYAPYTYKKLNIKTYVKEVMSAINQFEKIKNEIIELEGKLLKAMKLYNDDKNVECRVKAKLSKEELAALKRLGFWENDS